MPKVIEYLHTLQGVPKLLKSLVRHFVSKTGVPQGLTQYDELKLDQGPLDAEKLSQMLRQVVGSKIEDSLAPAASSLLSSFRISNVYYFCQKRKEKALLNSLPCAVPNTFFHA